MKLIQNLFVKDFHVNISKFFKNLNISNLFVCFYIYWLTMSYC